MKNTDKTSTEYDITLENKRLNELQSRQDVYDYFTQFEQPLNDQIKNAEVKVQTYQSFIKNGMFFIEHSMKKPHWNDFRPSGISTTKADNIILGILQEDETLHPIVIMVPTKWLKEKLEKGDGVGSITTHPLKNTGDINKGYLINVTKLLEELLVLNRSEAHHNWNQEIEENIKKQNR